MRPRKKPYSATSASPARQGTLVLSPFTAQAFAKFLKVRPEWWSEDVPSFATENGRSLDRSQRAAKVREYCPQAGVKVTPYGLRHSFVTESLKASNDPFALQRILGHQDLTMTRHYVRYLQDDIREAHDKASPVQCPEATAVSEKGLREGEHLCVNQDLSAASLNG